MTYLISLKVERNKEDEAILRKKISGSFFDVCRLCVTNCRVQHSRMYINRSNKQENTVKEIGIDGRIRSKGSNILTFLAAACLS